MSKFSSKEAFCQFVGCAWDEAEDYRYHHGMTNAPVYSVGNTYFIVTPNGKKPTKHDVSYITNDNGEKFAEASGTMAEYCKERGRTIWIYESK